MVIEYVRYQIPAATHAAFLEAYHAAGADLAASTHCRKFEISQGVEEPDNFVVRIEWDSIEGHEQGFRGSAEFTSFFARVKPYFPNIREMKHYQPR
jgi:quinol monooxygenase YgiN